MKGKPIQKDVKVVHNVDFLQYYSQRCRSTEMVGKPSQPTLMQGEHRGHNIIRYSYDLIISWGEWVRTRFEFAKYWTRIAYFHAWKKWVQREKCVLKSHLAYNDREYNKIWPEERSSHRERAHEGVVEVDDNCSIFSSTNPILPPWTNSVGTDCEVLMHLPNHVQNQSSLAAIIVFEAGGLWVCNPEKVRIVSHVLCQFFPAHKLMRWLRFALKTWLWRPFNAGPLCECIHKLRVSRVAGFSSDRCHRRGCLDILEARGSS